MQMMDLRHVWEDIVAIQYPWDNNKDRRAMQMMDLRHVWEDIVAIQYPWDNNKDR
jgi:hypothetical protein